jgi:hypothetical protein
MGYIYRLTLYNITGDMNLQNSILGRMISKRAPVIKMYTLFGAKAVLANTNVSGDQFQIWYRVVRI